MGKRRLTMLSAVVLFAMGCAHKEVVPPQGTGGSGPSDGQMCCKHCRNSQACGDSCISWGKTCHQPSGCACQE